MSLFARIMVKPASIGDIKTVIGLILEREDESMCVKRFPNSTKLSGKFPVHLETFQIIQKLSRFSTKFDLETF